LLADEARQWLRDALELVAPRHRWIERLRSSIAARDTARASCPKGPRLSPRTARRAIATRTLRRGPRSRGWSLSGRTSERREMNA
jgi:hypothetical protein